MNSNVNPYDLKVIQEYSDVMVDGLKHTFTKLTEAELREAINYSIGQRLYNGSASIDNNYTKRKLDGTVLDILAYIQSREPIMTTSGVLFKKHKDAENPLSEVIMGFLAQRKVYKKKMFSYPKGSDEFAHYNLMQLLEKLNG